MSDPPVAIQGETTVSDGKFAAYVVLGPPDTGDVDISFFITQGGTVLTDTTTLTKAAPADGSILYAWSARPTGSAGQWIEAYHPGTEIYRPMVLGLFRVSNGRPVRASQDDLLPIFQLSGACPAGSVLTTAPEGGIPLNTGEWATSLQLGTTPGRCELTAIIKENQGDGTWQTVLVTLPSAAVWAVEMDLLTLPPRIIVGVENTPVEDHQFQYTISPLEYFPERSAVFVAVDGQVVGVAETWSRGDGELSIQHGAVELNPEKACTVQGVLNPGVVWGQGAANPLNLQLAFEQRALNVVKAKVHIAMDGNRDDTIDFDDPEDERYLFWVNDDHDVKHWNEDMHQEDDEDGLPNCDDDTIGNYQYLTPDPIDDPFGKPDRCKRDLEDFARLQFEADEIASDLSDLVYSLKVEDPTSEAPSVNVFEAVDCSLDYLRETGVADSQIEKERMVTVDTEGEAVIESQYVSSGTESSCFILEGKSAGKGDLTLLVKKNGIVLSEESVELDLRPIGEFYDRFIVRELEGDTVDTGITETTIGSYPAENDEFVLFVHGWNVDDWTKDRWAETIFKRLWWLGYKGRVGSFQWPTLGMFHYDRSEIRAWNSAEALKNLIGALNLSNPGNVRIIAHSQGNVVASEALRLSSSNINSYIATQAALSGHSYDNTIDPYWANYETPNVYGYYYSGVPADPGDPPIVPYFDEVPSKVDRIFRYYNEDDWALNLWKIDNQMKPDFNYYYSDLDGNIDTYGPWDRFYYDSPAFGDERDLVFPDDRYEIFARCAESRSFALGAVATEVSGFNGERDLKSEFGYHDNHYSHSREFRSNVVDERLFWLQVARDFRLTFIDPGE